MKKLHNEQENCDCEKDKHEDCDCRDDCKCNEDCDCEKDCTCDAEDKCSKDCDCKDDCKCCDDCDCGEDCECGAEDKCSENCTCEKDKSDEKCHKHSHCKKDKEGRTQSHDYLTDLLRVQAEFDNYRKRTQNSIAEARKDGFIDAIEEFLPALDSFKMATDMITDKNTLMGIKFIEKGILDTLSKMGVEPIDCSGKFDPELHQAIDTDSTADVESGMIVKEAYKGFTYKGKVIRYAQVIVKK